MRDREEIRPTLRVEGPLAYDPALDGLRAVAIALVMMRHFAHMEASTTVATGLVRALTAPGWIGVDLFFVLSGFLITRICLEHRGAGFFRAFYIRRGLRILPPYALVLAIVLAVAPFVAPPVHGALWLATFTANISIAIHGTWRAVPVAATHFWSLAVEEQFYALWPWVAATRTNRTVLRVALVAIPAALVARLALNLFGATRLAAVTLMPARMDTLAIGAALAVVADDPLLRARLEPIARRIGAAPPRYWLVALVGLLLGIAALTGDGEQYGVQLQTVGMTLIAVACGTTVAAVAFGTRESPLRRALSAKAAVAVGRYSYAMYLIHVPVNVTITGLWREPDSVGSALAVTAIGSAATFTLAALSWRFVERPALSLKRLAPYGPRQSTPAQACAAIGDAMRDAPVAETELSPRP